MAGDLCPCFPTKMIQVFISKVIDTDRKGVYFQPDLPSSKIAGIFSILCWTASTKIPQPQYNSLAFS